MSRDTNEASRTEAGALGGGDERAVYRALLVENRRFRNLFFAMLTSSLGDWTGLFAILALTESLAGGVTRAGAFALSGIMVARVLPTMLLGPVAGVFVDRWDRRRLLIATDVGRGIVMALLALSGDYFQLVVATFLIEVMSTLFIPAKDATLPNLVRKDRLVQANQLSLMVTYGTLPIGAGLFAALAAVSGAIFGGVEFLAERPAAVPIWANAFTFLLSAVFINRIGIRAEEAERIGDRPAEGPGAWQELKDGFAFIASQPLIRALVVGVMATFLAAGVPASGVGTNFATILNAGPSGFGVLGAVVGTGLFVGLLSAGPLARRISKERLFAPGIGIAGVGLVVAAFMPRLDLASIPAFIMGAGAGLSFVTGYTMLQERSTDEIRGRTFAAFNTGVRLALFASLVVGPLIVATLGPEQAGPDGTYPYSIGGVRITLMIAGLVAFAGAVWTGRSVHEVLTSKPESLHLPEAGEPAVSRQRHGLFVAFEGGEGAGKSTQIRLLRAAVERAGYDVVMTREPGGTPIGEQIRDLLLDPSSEAMSDRTEALLFAAARAQHAEEVIRPALEKGAVVLCDRYVDSSIIYQGVGRALGEEQIEELNRWGSHDLQPDLVVLLDVDPSVGFERAGAEHDRMEGSGEAFHRMVNSGFRRRAQIEPTRYLVLDASRPVEDLAVEIRDEVLHRAGGDVEEPHL